MRVHLQYHGVLCDRYYAQRVAEHAQGIRAGQIKGQVLRTRGRVRGGHLLRLCRMSPVTTKPLDASPAGASGRVGSNHPRTDIHASALAVGLNIVFSLLNETRREAPAKRGRVVNQSLGYTS